MQTYARAALLAAAPMLAILSAPRHALALESVTVAAVGSGSANDWPAYGAIANGYFKAAGFDVSYIGAPSSAAAMQELAAESVDMGSGGLVDPLRAIDKGAPITLMRIEARPGPYEVYAKPSIHSFAELKRKIVILGGVKDITRIYFDRMATPEGLPPGSYDMVFAGATSARLSALISGSVDAAILNPPFIFKAQDEKFTRLAAAPDFDRGVPFTGYSVSLTWAKAHRPLIAKFLAAYAKGVAWLFDPAHREAAVNLLVKRVATTHEDAEKTYEMYMRLKVFDRSSTIAKSDLQPLMDILKKQGDLDGPADFSRFYQPALLGLDSAR